MTKQGVTAFQRMNNLPSTGEADVTTLAAVIRRLRTQYPNLSSSSSSITPESPPEAPGSQKQDLLRDKSRSQLPNRAHRATTYSPKSGPSPTNSRRSSATLEFPQKRTPSSLQFSNTNDDTMSTSSSTSSRPPSRGEDTPPSSVPPTPRSETPQPGQAKPATPAADNAVFEQLYLRIPTHVPVWVYCSELQDVITLVVISKGLVFISSSFSLYNINRLYFFRKERQMRGRG